MRPAARAAIVTVAVAASVVIVVLAGQARPQGNVARALPYSVALALLWTVTAGVVAGPRRALRVAAVLTILGAIAVAAYVIALEPIRVAECGVLAEELGNRSCRDHASWEVVAAAGVAANLGAAGLYRARVTPGRPG